MRSPRRRRCAADGWACGGRSSSDSAPSSSWSCWWRRDRAGLVGVGPGRRRRWGHRTSSTRRRRRLHHVYGGGDTAVIGGGMAVLDCDRDGGPTSSSRAGTARRRCSGTFRRGRGDRLHPGRESGHGHHGRDGGAYPIDIDGDGNPDWSSCGRRGGGPAARAGRPPVRARQRHLGVPAAHGLGDGVQRHLGGEQPLAHARTRRSTPGSCATVPREMHTCAPPPRPLPPWGRGHGPRNPDPALRPATAPCPCCSSDPHGPGLRDLRIANDRHYYDALSSNQGGSCGDRRPAHARRARPQRDVEQLQLVGDGDRQPGPQRRRPAEDLHHQPGRQQAPDLGQRASAAHDPRHRAEERRDRYLSRSTGATRCRRPPGTPSSRMSTTMASWTSTSRRATSTRCPTTRAGHPDLYIGEQDGTFSEQAVAGGINYDHSLGAALVDLNGDGLLDLVEAKVNAPNAGFPQRGRALWRCCRRWATGWASGPRRPAGIATRTGACDRGSCAGALDVRREACGGGGHQRPAWA